MDEERGPGIGNRLAPPRFLAFAAALLIAVPAALPLLGARHAAMAGFDLAALIFILSCVPLLRHRSDDMRRAACRNDANRAMLLAITGAVMLAILAAVASELMQREAPEPWSLALVVATLAIAWTFSNLVYALHYAHLFYSREDDADRGGLQFPGTGEPDYWDFVYFGFCLGMTFQTSDVTVTDGRVRRVVTFHCLAAFVFNLGILAFTINVLGG